MQDSASDIIYIHDLKFDTIIGLLPSERGTPQPICINLQVTVDTTVAAVSTNIQDSLDYAALAEAVKKLTMEAECLLVETLAGLIADLVLSYPLAQGVLVDICKPEALSDAAGVGVKIYRRR